MGAEAFGIRLATFILLMLLLRPKPSLQRVFILFTVGGRGSGSGRVRRWRCRHNHGFVEGKHGAVVSVRLLEKNDRVARGGEVVLNTVSDVFRLTSGGGTTSFNFWPLI